jgi:hypothetical protein
MKDTLVVTALNDYPSQPFKLAFESEGKTIFISRDKRLHVMDSDVYRKKMHLRKASKALNVETITFEAAKKNKAGRMSFKYEVKVDDKGHIDGIDTEGTVLKPTGIHGDQAYGIFFTLFPYKIYNGVRQGAGQKFNVVLSGQMKKVKTLDVKKELEAANIINKMSLTDLKAVGTLLSIPTLGRTKEDLFESLTNRQSGIVYSPMNFKLFCETYIDKTNKNSEVIMLINKAIELGVIKFTKKTEKQVYTYKDVQLGYDKEEVVTYLNKNEDTRRSITLTVSITMEEKGGEEVEVVEKEAKATDSEDLTMMREALSKIQKTEENPTGTYDIGKKQIMTIAKDKIREDYKKFVLKQE